MRKIPLIRLIDGWVQKNFYYPPYKDQHFDWGSLKKVESEWKQNPLPDPHYIVTLGEKKQYFCNLRFSKDVYEKMWSEAQKLPIKLATGVYGAEKQEYYIYMYKEAFYLTEMEMASDDVALVIETTKKDYKQKLANELDKIKAVAEAEGYNREPIPEDVQVLVWNRDGGKCVRCGSNISLEFDHIIPLSKGGSNTARNIQLLCEKCNRSKGAKVGG